MPNNTFEGQFPNLFVQLQALEEGQKDMALVEGYIESIIKRLRLPHYSAEDFLSTDGDYTKLKEKAFQSDGFFDEMVKVSDALSQEQSQDLGEDQGFELKLNIAGGVVRTLLGKMYQLAHERHQQQSKETNESIIEAIPGSEDFSEEQQQLKSAILKSTEFHIKQTTIAEKDALFSPFVLGVGSDLDVFYEIRTENGEPPTIEQKAAAQEVAKQLVSYINAVEEIKGLRNLKDPMKHSMLPVADVKDYDKQLSRVLEQGGNMLDTLAFTVNPNVEKDKTVRRIKHAEGQEDVMRQFFEGVYEYVSPKPGEKSSHKQAIRGLRPLLEIPFLQLKDNTILEQELQSIIESVADGAPLSADAVTQFNKMLRNANFQGAGNRAYFDKESPIGLGLTLAKAVRGQGSQDESERLRLLLPEFLQKMPIDEYEAKKQSLKGEQYGLLSEGFVPLEEFVEQYTTDGKLFHGTGVAAGMNILRGGFVVSSKTSGTALYGPGTYAAKSYQGALTYAGNDGIVLPINVSLDTKPNIVRLQDIKEPEVYQALVAEATAKGFTDNHSDEKEAIFEMLRDRNEYAVDIIIGTNDYMVVQNQSVLDVNVDLKPIIDWFQSKCLSDTHAFVEGEKSTTSDINKSLKTYLNFKQMLTDLGYKDKGLFKQFDLSFESLLFDWIQSNIPKVVPGLPEGEESIQAYHEALAQYFSIESMLSDLGRKESNHAKILMPQINSVIDSFTELDNNQKKLWQIYTTLSLKDEKLANDLKVQYPWLKSYQFQLAGTLTEQPVEYFIAQLILKGSPNQKQALKEMKLLPHHAAGVIAELAGLNQPEAIKEILSLYSIQLDVTNSLRQTCMTLAMEKCNLQAIKCLTSMGALETEPNNADLMVQAVRMNEPEIVKYLFEHGLDVNGFSDRYTQTPLQAATKHENITMAQWLVEQGADLSKVQGFNLLTNAIYDENEELFEWLLSMGADVNAQSKDDKSSPLKYCFDRMNVSTFARNAAFRMLSLKANPNIKLFGRTVLNKAIGDNDLELTKALLEAGADPNESDNLWSLLERAISEDKTEIVSLLLDAGADPNPKDSRGRSLLDKIIQRVDKKTLTLLLQAGADYTEDHSKVLFELVTGENPDALRAFKECGANLDCTNKYGKTLFEEALSYNRFENLDILMELGVDIQPYLGKLFKEAIYKKNIKMIDKLIEWASDLDCYYNKKPLLSVAIEDGNIEILQKLIDAGANIDAKNEYGTTVLDTAIMDGKLDMMQCLIRAGVDITQGSPLISAINFNRDFIEPLVEAGANMYATNQHGISVSEAALMDLDALNRFTKLGLVLKLSDEKIAQLDQYPEPIAKRATELLEQQKSNPDIQKSQRKKTLRFSDKAKDEGKENQEQNVQSKSKPVKKTKF